MTEKYYSCHMTKLQKKWKQWLVWNELLVCCVCVCDENWVLTRVIWLVSTLNYDHDNIVDDRKILFVSHDKITKIKWKWNLVWIGLFVCCVCVYVMKPWCWLVSYGWYQHWIIITITVDDRKILFVSHDKITKIKWK